MNDNAADRLLAKEPVRAAGWRQAVTGNVLMMGLVSFFCDSASEMMYPLLPVFFTGLVPVALAPVYLGLMEGIAESTASVLKIFSGRISDSLGKRKSLAVIGYGLSSACRPLMALVFAGWHIIGLRFIDRVGKGVRTAPRDALIGDSVPPGVRGLAFSFHRVMDHAGAIVGSLLAIGILYCFLGYGLWSSTGSTATPAEMHAMRWLFAIAFIPGIATMVVLVSKVREIVPARKAGAGAAHAAKNHLPRKFHVFVSIVTLFALGNSSDLFIVFYGKTLFGLGLLQVIGLWVALHASKIAFSFPGGILSDKLGRRPIIVTGWIVYALVYLGMALVVQQWLFWALILAYGIYYGMTEGVEKALVCDFVPSEHRGRAYGLYHGAVGIAALPASLLFGVFWAALGPKLAFGIGAGLAGLAAILLIVLLSTEKPAAECPLP